ncbi:MAG: 16S rRNA (guanine(527)-N(7))-methyltransferase RsmG [Eubacterium sp.]|jgi:16S rRNA (guanine(527)-N(7))-methyltransferase RsmG|nr:16S rRNA (guanine(527)-N(7))-methyltransferase RsmG [Eubacterium sp.]
MTHIFTEQEKSILEKMTDFMLEYNQKVNLTRITAYNEIFEKHYIDSAIPLDLLDVPRGTSLIDIGTGAGFPGVPIKIARPDIKLTLLDSLKKRINYLNLLKLKLGTEYETIHGRSEELARSKEFREKYDVGISRAVANLPALCEYALPLVKPDGFFIAMKGENCEIESAEMALKLLGGSLVKTFKYELPSGDKRSLVIIKKISQTSAKYPRLRVNIIKTPL